MHEYPLEGYPVANARRNPQRSVSQTLSSPLEFYNSALEAYRGGMGPIVGIQLGEDIFDAALYRFFGDGQQIGDLLVCISGCNQPKDLHFAGGQGIVCRMFGEFEGGLRRQALLAGMNRPNGIQQILV